MFKNHLRQDIYQPLNFSAMNFWNTAVNTAACPRRLGHDLFQWPGWKPSWWLIVETGNKNKDPSLRIQENKAIKRWTELAAKPPAASECTSSWARSKAASQWFKPIFLAHQGLKVERIMMIQLAGLRKNSLATCCQISVPRTPQRCFHVFSPDTIIIIILIHYHARYLYLSLYAER